ncbi:1-aminocyclopropane-1-carboxylate synthase [Genlisea aurea]|uniref:1-aminocyclopropane-1-carboxylate synthase n=1 Tax=Genlisea aurea TaxID=192259 RepID=S8CYD8_9LAMI|nr:1-aminocyclopropane-1-carboxylate synthase [Genlisea aurea]
MARVKPRISAGPIHSFRAVEGVWDPFPDEDFIMKRTENSTANTTTTGGGGAAGMRIIVPLQGVVHGRAGLILGTVIPCALFYFLQLYLKNRGAGGRPSASSPPPEDEDPSSSSSSSSTLQRVHSRLLLLSPRSSGGPVRISSRASAVIRQSDGAYYTGLKRVEEDPFHEIDNPNGVIQLAVPENRSMVNLVQEWISDHLIGKGLNINGITTYQPFDGLMELKAAAAGFVLQVTEKSFRIDPTQIVVTAGVTSGIEALVFSLSDPGNAFLVPSPYSPELDGAVKWRTGVEIIQIPCRSSDGFGLSIAAVDRAYNQAKKQGVKVSGIILSNPSNPFGVVYTREALYNLLDFATEKNIHIISVETLVGSARGAQEFVSMAEVAGTEEAAAAFDGNNRVHLVYDLANDLSIIYTTNEGVSSAAKRLSRFSSVSVPAQQLLISMFSDTKFVERSVSLTRGRVSRMHSEFVSWVEERLGIRCFEGSSGGLYCWADMSRFIPTYNEEGEMELWNKMVSVAKINALPGSACHCVEPGWFGFCLAALGEEQQVAVVVQRIRRLVLETCK